MRTWKLSQNDGNTTSKMSQNERKNTSSKTSKSHRKNKNEFVHLLQQLVLIGSANRTDEYLESMQYNINHTNVRNVYILEESWRVREAYEKRLRDPNKKVIFLPFGRQPNYTDIFHIVTNYVEPRREEGEVWMVSNADIMIGEGIDLLRGKISNKTLLTLSRHSSKRCPKRDHNQCLSWVGSADAFIGVGPIKTDIITKLNFKQNTAGAENVVLFEFKKAGYSLLNPCRNVKIYHNHCSGERLSIGNRINRQRGSASIKPSSFNV